MTKRLTAALLLGTLIGLAPAAWGQGYGYPPPPGTAYRQLDRHTVVGADGRVYIRRGNTLILADDPYQRPPYVGLPPGSRIVGYLANSVMIETADGQRQICTPVGGQTICH